MLSCEIQHWKNGHRWLSCYAHLLAQKTLVLCVRHLVTDCKMHGILQSRIDKQIKQTSFDEMRLSAIWLPATWRKWQTFGLSSKKKANPRKTKMNYMLSACKTSSRRLRCLGKQSNLWTLVSAESIKSRINWPVCMINTVNMQS